MECHVEEGFNLPFLAFKCRKMGRCMSIQLSKLSPFKKYVLVAPVCQYFGITEDIKMDKILNSLKD